jgi:hypothetical protein
MTKAELIYALQQHLHSEGLDEVADEPEGSHTLTITLTLARLVLAALHDQLS